MHERALQLTEGLEPTPNNLLVVAAQVGGSEARWAFSQWGLRKRAAVKFSRANEMLFTKEALEQATSEPIARYHASRFPSGQLVVDATCGIGGDLIALAERGPVIGYELDAERAQCARHNLRTYGLEAEVIVGDGLEASRGASYVYCDPARRSAGRRVEDPNDFQPPLNQIVNALRSSLLVGTKLSPMLPDTLLESMGGDLEFISFQGECREALVWLGTGAGSSKAAVQIESGCRLAPTGPPPILSKAERWIFEADPAAIRVHGLGTLCAMLGLAALGDSNGYLTGPDSVSNPWLKAYKVQREIPFDRKRLRLELKELALDPVDVKVRGRRMDANTIANEMRRPGDKPCAVILYPSNGKIRSAITLSNSP